jgi:glutathione S-transferase
MWSRAVHFVPQRARLKCEALLAQGIAGHSANDINLLMEDSISGLSKLLGDKAYLTGSKPVAADASIFGVLDQILYDENPNRVPFEAVSRHPNLVKFVDNIRRTFYSDAVSGPQPE